MRGLISDWTNSLRFYVDEQKKHQYKFCLKKQLSKNIGQSRLYLGIKSGKMKTTLLREKLHRYIEVANDKKLRAIYTMVEAEADIENPWNDKAFIAEMNKRVNELETGKVKGYSWEEVKQHTAKTLKAIKGK